MGPLIPLFWTSGDVCPGFQSQGGFPRLRASSPSISFYCNDIIAFANALVKVHFSKLTLIISSSESRCMGEIFLRETSQLVSLPCNL